MSKDKQSCEDDSAAHNNLEPAAKFAEKEKRTEFKTSLTYPENHKM